MQLSFDYAGGRRPHVMGCVQWQSKRGPCMLYRNLDCAFTLYEWQLVILPYDERVLIHSYEMARTF